MTNGLEEQGSLDPDITARIVDLWKNYAEQLQEKRAQAAEGANNNKVGGDPEKSKDTTNSQVAATSKLK